MRGVEAHVRPHALVERSWAENVGLLDGWDRRAAVDLLAFGKASVGMAATLIDRLGERVDRGLVLAPDGRKQDVEAHLSPPAWNRVDVRTVDHPTPTARNVDAARAVEGFVREGAARANGRMLLALVSGGGSAHLALPGNGLALEDVAAVATRLMRAGASIHDLNTVRKHLELLKGGRLAELASGESGGSGYAAVVVLVISDVIGDDLSVVASGPFSPDPTTFRDAMRVLDSCGVSRVDAPAVWRSLERGARGELVETPKPGAGCFSLVHTRVIGSNRDAMAAACGALETAGVRIAATRGGIVGEARDRAGELVREAIAAGSGRLPAAIVWGGETTVTVGDATGVGGRNQEFVLAAAEELDTSSDGVSIMIASFGTDGIDGTTNAAGAFATGETWRAIRRAGIEPARALADHDSHTALAAADSLLRTGATGTNVNDVMVAIVGVSDGRVGGGR